MISREDFKMIAAGKYALMSQTFDKKELDLFVDASVFSYDYLKKYFTKEIPELTIPNALNGFTVLTNQKIEKENDKRN
jgi:hypothetical protein